MSRIRVAVVARRRAGLLKAKETAVFETPAFSATSVIVTRRGPWSTRFSSSRNRWCDRPRHSAEAGPHLLPEPGDHADLSGRAICRVYHGPVKNRFSKPV